MKNLGEAAYIIGMKIYRDRSKRLFGLSQSTCIDTMLKQFSMENFKKDDLPIDQKKNFSKEDYPTTPQERERMSRVSYTSTVDFIIYAMICMRLDMVYSLEVVSRYQSNPRKNH